jgi:hypothetical protein
MAIKNTTLDDLSAVIGFSATVKLTAWFGGMNVWVPLKVEEGQALGRLIGLPAAKRLSGEWGGDHVAIPPLTAYKTEARRRMVGRMLEKGFSASETSRLTQLSERRVQQICQELEQDGLIEPVAPKPGRKPRGEIPQAKSPEANPQAKSLREKTAAVAAVSGLVHRLRG